LIPARPGMLFRVASISKIFTAAALCRLSESGRVRLDDPAEKWLPEGSLSRIKGHREITVRLLLNHRSGIDDYDERAILALQRAQPASPVEVGFAISQGLDKGPLYAPDGGYTYSNVNYLLLSLVIDSASGTSYERCMRDTIIDPLGLTNTYTPTDPSAAALPEPFMGCLCVENNEPADYSATYKMYDRGAGDIISTVQDLNAFHEALRECRIIDRTSLAQMEDFHSASTHGYGLGYMRRRDDASGVTLVGHEGAYPGSWTRLYYWVEADTYIAANVNGGPANVVAPIISYLQQELR